jgi:hypothetical protein
MQLSPLLQKLEWPGNLVIPLYLTTLIGQRTWPSFNILSLLMAGLFGTWQTLTIFCFGGGSHLFL